MTARTLVPQTGEHGHLDKLIDDQPFRHAGGMSACG